MEEIKVYVEVIARFTADGRLQPVAFTWEDGRRYEIDRIVKCVRCASRKASSTPVTFSTKRSFRIWKA